MEALLASEGGTRAWWRSPKVEVGAGQGVRTQSELGQLDLQGSKGLGGSERWRRGRAKLVHLYEGFLSCQVVQVMI